MSIALSAKALSKSYKLGKVETPVLHELTFIVNEGEFVALTGPSGSGKSTLLNLIGGLDRPSSGTLDVYGQVLGAMKDRPIAQYRQKTVGMVFQSFNLLPQATAEQNVVLAALFAGESPKKAKERARELFERVGLTDRSHHRPTELSGGEQQRVAIVRALMNRPRILLADEPTGNLDSKTGAGVIQLITDLAREGNMTLFIVTHDEHLAASANRRLRLLDGRLDGGAA